MVIMLQVIPSLWLILIFGKDRSLTWDELSEILDKLGFEPQIQELN